MTREEALRSLPSVHELVEAAGACPLPRPIVVEEARSLLADCRAALRDQGEQSFADLPQRLRDRIARLAEPSLRRVINATGVVLHTNLGRAPLAPLSSVEGYSNLEYDLARGSRGRRDVHCGPLLERLTGSSAIVVNNNAAAVYLALHELAAGHEVVVSRGELIEIGDGFRIPDIMARSGAILREVGTTNRTHLDDYRAAINERTRLILKVHPSNFRIAGFASQPATAEIAALARERNVPLYEDIGSGCLADLRGFGIDEPRPADSLRDGVNLVSFSGDKLLGGPQAGILAGDPALVTRLRRNPMFRALRVDKLILGALESALRATLTEAWDHIPALRMIRQPAELICERALRLIDGLPPGFATVEAAQSVIGGGSTPEQSLATFVIVLRGPAAAFERTLRLGAPPVIARIENDRLLLDLRTVFEDEEPVLRHRLAALA